MQVVIAWLSRAVWVISGTLWGAFRRRSAAGQAGITILLVAVAVWAGSVERHERSPRVDSLTVATAEQVPARQAELPQAGRAPAVEVTTPVPSAADEIAVASVTDGDTIRLSDGRAVRLAQVDAPERGACFGTESTTALKALVEGRSVGLRRPPTGPEKDRYGRTLADVTVGGQSVNQLLVEQGAAEWYEEFAHEDADLAERLRAAEVDARSAGLGLWSACGFSTRSASAPTTAAPATTPTTAAAPPPRSAQPSSRGGCHASYTRTCIPEDVSDADCASGTGNGPWYVQERDIGVVGPDVFDLDRDGDGVGCES